MRRAWRRPSLPLLLWCLAVLGVVAMGGCGPAEAQDQPAPLSAGPDWPTLIAGALTGLAAFGSLVGGGTYARRKWTQPTDDEPVPPLEARVAVLEERSDSERHESRLLRKKVHKIGNVVFALAHAAGIDPDEVEDSDEDDEPSEKRP